MTQLEDSLGKGTQFFSARGTVPFLPKPSSSRSLKCRTPPNREKRRSPLKVLSREGCESSVSSYIWVAPPWCKVMVRNPILDTSSEINHSTVPAAITRMIGYRTLSKILHASLPQVTSLRVIQDRWFLCRPTLVVRTVQLAWAQTQTLDPLSEIPSNRCSSPVLHL